MPGTRRSCSTASIASRASRRPARRRARPTRRAPRRRRSTATSPRPSAKSGSRSGLPRPDACSTARDLCRAQLGLLVVAALLLGLPALACELLERRRSGRPAGRASPAGPRTQAVGARRSGAVAGAGNGPVQPDGTPAPPLHREHHAGGGRHGGDRPRLGLRPSQPRAGGRARGVPARPDDLPRAAAVRDPARVVGGDRLCPRGARGRRPGRAAGPFVGARAGPREPAGRTRLGLGAGDPAPHHRHQPTRRAAAAAAGRAQRLPALPPGLGPL